jgi:hypothetical protein
MVLRGRHAGWCCYFESKGELLFGGLLCCCRLTAKVLPASSTSTAGLLSIFTACFTRMTAAESAIQVQRGCSEAGLLSWGQMARLELLRGAHRLVCQSLQGVPWLQVAQKT